MSIINSLEKIKVSSFLEFCNVFDIKPIKEGGRDGFDEDLIKEELIKIPNQKWLLNFIDNRRDGYFLLQLLE